MKFKTDLNRQTKILMGIVVAVITTIFGFIIYSWAAAPTVAQSSISKAQPLSSKKSNQSTDPLYKEQLKDLNQTGSQHALKTNDTFLSVPIVTAQPLKPTVQPLPPVDPVKRQRQTQSKPAPAPAGLTPEQATQKAKDVVLALQSDWGNTDPSISEAMEVKSYATLFVPAVATSSALHAAAQNVSLSTPPTRLFEAFKTCAAQLKPELNTDVNSAVIASLWCSGLTGAKVFAPGYKLVGDNIDMTFTMMVYNGDTYKITAKPVDPDTGRTMLSGDVDNRYVERILIPGLAKAISNVGKQYEQNNGTTTTVSDGVVIQSNSSTVDKNQVMGSFVGGLGEQTASVLNADASRIPPRKVSREANTTITIMFLEPVLSSDRVDKAIQSAPANGTTPTVVVQPDQGFSQPAAQQETQQQYQALSQGMQSPVGFMPQQNRGFATQN